VTAAGGIGRLRAAAQRLVGPPAAGAAEAVRELTAIQAQDYPGAVTSVALRTASRARSEVEKSLDAGEIVRSWPMRGTLHLVCAGDLPWMLALLAPRVVKASARRRAGLGLDDAQLERGRELAVAALRGGRALDRRALFQVWDDGGLATTGQRGVHVLGYLAQTGTLVLGPVRDGRQLVVLSSEWITAPRRLEGEEALGELAWRYFRSHGPATLRDLARWAGLTLTEARAGLAEARPGLEAFEVDGVEHLMDPETPERLARAGAQADGVILLPGFDELLLGYGDRSAMLEPRFAERIVPGRNGMFRPTVISAGRVIGTWRHGGRAGRRTVDAEPFEFFSAQQTEAIERAYEALP
jgi:hypothetical protein